MSSSPFGRDHSHGKAVELRRNASTCRDKED